MSITIDLFDESSSSQAPQLANQSLPPPKHQPPAEHLSNPLYQEIYNMLSPEFQGVFKWTLIPCVHKGKSLTHEHLNVIFKKTSVVVAMRLEDTKVEVDDRAIKIINSPAFSALFNAINHRKVDLPTVICNLNKYKSIIFKPNFNNFSTLAFVLDVSERTIRNALKSYCSEEQSDE